MEKKQQDILKRLKQYRQLFRIMAKASAKKASEKRSS